MRGWDHQVVRGWDHQLLCLRHAALNTRMFTGVASRESRAFFASLVHRTPAHVIARFAAH